MTDIHRMRRLAGLQEARQIMDPDEEQERDDARYEREAKIQRLIQVAFSRIGLTLADDGLYYDEDDREAQVTLDDSEVALDMLLKLKETGLASDYAIKAGQYELVVVFHVSPELDHAVV